MKKALSFGVGAVAFALTFCGAATAAEPRVPQYKVDANWPKPLPNNWIIGGVSGLYADPQDHIWVIHRPNTVPPQAARGGKNPDIKCCVPAPAVIEFSPAGDVLRAWGGPGEGYDWPSTEHGVTVDPKGNVWVLGNGGGPIGADGKPDRTKDDGMALKFTADGKFLLQVGGRGGGNNLDTSKLNHAPKVVFDPKTNEAIVADGYGNKRVIVFDADTGKFKRMWGAYGKPPVDEADAKHDGAYPLDAAPKQFLQVHCVMRSNDDMVYVCDRLNNRMQVFQKNGTFVKEFLYPAKLDGFPGKVSDMAFSIDAAQTYIIITDANRETVRIARRDTGKDVGEFGRPGTAAGEFKGIHVITVDSKGNVFVGEAANARLQRFTPG